MIHIFKWYPMVFSTKYNWMSSSNLNLSCSLLTVHVLPNLSLLFKSTSLSCLPVPGVGVHQPVLSTCLLSRSPLAALPDLSLLQESTHKSYLICPWCRGPSPSLSCLTCPNWRIHSRFLSNLFLVQEFASLFCLTCPWCRSPPPCPGLLLPSPRWYRSSPFRWSLLSGTQFSTFYSYSLLSCCEV